jgi:hypothetical protein
MTRAFRPMFRTPTLSLPVCSASGPAPARHAPVSRAAVEPTSQLTGAVRHKSFGPGRARLKGGNVAAQAADFTRFI